MAHISSIGSAMFSDLSVAYGTNTAGVMSQTLPAGNAYTIAALQALFVTATSKPTYMQYPNIRSFPAMGLPANIVNVPVYGARIAQTVGGQANPPSLDFVFNYIPADWGKGSTASVMTNNVVSTRGNEIGNAIADGISRIWRLTLLTSAPNVVGAAALSSYDSIATGLGTVPNTQYYFLGKAEALIVTPSLTDATTATMSLSMQSDFYGAWTV